MNKIHAVCSLCNGRSDFNVHLPLFVDGSEGVAVCAHCRTQLTEYARQMKTMAARVLLQDMKRYVQVEVKTSPPEKVKLEV